MNQAANSTLMARLEAQRAICDSAEKDLCRQLKKRDEIESQIGPYWEQARKRSRMDDTLFQEKHDKTIHFIPRTRARKPPYEELNPLVAKTGTFLGQEREQEEDLHPLNNVDVEGPEENENHQSLIAIDNEKQLDDGHQKFSKRNSYCQISSPRKTVTPAPQSPLEEDEEYTRKIGKGNLDKWLQMLLENTQEDQYPESPPQNTDELANMTGKTVPKLNLRNPQKEIPMPKLKASKEVGINQKDLFASGEMLSNGTSEFKCTKQQAEGAEGEGYSKMFEESNISKISSACNGVRSNESSEVGKEMGEMNAKVRKLVKRENGGAFRPIPSSPSVISGMRRGADCTRKPLVVGDDENVKTNKFFKTPIAQAIKKALKK